MAPRRPPSAPDAESPLPHGADGEVPLVGVGRLLRTRASGASVPNRVSPHIQLMATASQLESRFHTLQQSVDQAMQTLLESKRDLKFLEVALHDAACCRGHGETGTSFSQLTWQEHRIATMAGAGYSNAQIAVTFNITVDTVKSHLRQVFRKTGVHCRGELGHPILDHSESDLPTCGTRTPPERDDGPGSRRLPCPPAVGRPAGFRRR